MNSIKIAKFLGSIASRRSYSSSVRYGDYELLKVSSPSQHVLHVELNRPEKRNALTRESFREINEVFNEITADTDCRAVVLSGTGKMFCAGIDFMDLMDAFSGAAEGKSGREDIAGRSKFIKQLIAQMQQPFTAIAKCPKPVIAAVHSGVIGAGVDMIAAVDVRYASADTYVREPPI